MVLDFVERFAQVSSGHDSMELVLQYHFVSSIGLSLFQQTGPVLREDGGVGGQRK
jgi:hypothetical protein